MRVAVCVLLAACYAPRPPEGVACVDDAHCPTSQRCIAGLCVAPGTGGPPDAIGDAAPDGNPDVDGDGVPNALDNCPNTPNPGQENEDGDALGDACDPCPVDANNADADGDGVGDACDPNPTLPGDHLVFFEGFHHGVPPTWTTSTGITAMNDDVVLPGTAAVHKALGPPMSAPADATVSAAIVVDTVTATTGDADAGVGLPYGPTDDGGILCWLYQLPNNGTRELRLNDHTVVAPLASGMLAWQTGTPYVLSLTRKGTSYSCTGGPLGGTPTTITGSSPSLPMAPIAAARAYATTANVRWLMLVQSP